MHTGDLARARSGMPLLAALLLFVAALAVAQTFPPLTGRVVDQANVLSPEAEAGLESKLADLEARSGIQLVVATVDSLEGQEIEPYANELFRAWRLGEAERNNGVLLLVAPNERRVRKRMRNEGGTSAITGKDLPVTSRSIVSLPAGGRKTAWARSSMGA